MQLIAKYAAPPSADRFQPVTADELRQIQKDMARHGDWTPDVERAEEAIAAAERGDQVLHAMDEDGDYFAIA